MKNGFLKCNIRWMIRRDQDEVQEIERLSDQGQRLHSESQWSVAEYVRHLRQRNCIAMVAEYDDKIVGVIVYELNKRNLRIIRLLIHPEFRRRGIGSQLIWKMIGKLCYDRRHLISIVAPETAMDLLMFLKKMGFVAQNVLRNWFDTEDGFGMSYDLKVRSVENF